MIHKALAKFRGKNLQSTPPNVIINQMLESRPLPLGVQEFHEWSERIISGALVPGTIKSQKFALAEMIMHLKPTESHCPDAHFIHTLRKGAANQVAYAIMEELRNERKAELLKEEEEKKLKVVGDVSDK